MKKLVVMGAIVASLFATLPATAQQQTSSQKDQAKSLPSPQAFDKQMAEAQSLMKRMQEQMGGIRQSQDAQERQRLLQEHWTTMQSAMATMHGMWGPGMMGCCGNGSGMMGNHGMMMGGQGMMGWGGMSHYYSKLTPAQQKQRQYMMDQYVGMQQMMMDQMMQRQQWMMQPPSSAPSK